jgi:selenoprotein W-related protein
LGELLKEKYNANVELIPSEGGVFEVVVDNNLIYSKKALNRFPEDGEVEGIIGQV